MRTIAVTGVSGHVGQRLLRLLDADREVSRIVGIDAREPMLRPRKLDFYRVDLASADIKPLLEGVDVLVHLAFATSPAHQPAILNRVNVEGTRRLLDAAGSVGVRHVVLTSSAMVYGAWPDNPVPLTEDAVVRPNPGFAYAAQKAEAERLVQDWKADHPGTTATILRPAASPGADQASWLAKVWRGSMPVRVRATAPPVQYVHEDDLAAAVGLAVAERPDGVFNVAPDSWIAGEEARALATGLSVGVPERLAARAHEVGFAIGVSGLPAQVLPYTVHPWVVANDRLKAVGWTPEHTNEEALVTSADLPPWRSFLTRHRQEAALAGAAVLLVGLAGGAVAVVKAVRRHRRSPH